MKPTWAKRARLSCIAVLMSGLAAQAAPVTYSFDDTAFAGTAGVGQFTFDLPDSTGITTATGVSGWSPLFGSWAGVAFFDVPGSSPTLVIGDITLSGPFTSFSSDSASTGGVANDSSSSLDDWQAFIDYWEPLGVKIEVISTVSTVPDGGPIVGLTAALLGRFGLYARHRGRRP